MPTDNILDTKLFCMLFISKGATKPLMNGTTVFTIDNINHDIKIAIIDAPEVLREDDIKI